MTAPTELGFSLVDLSDQTGLSPRTIHYYSSQGLLPAANRRGAGARYPRITLDRLLAIQRFKAELRFTLQEIRRVLGSLSTEEIHAVASGEVSPWNLLERPAARPGHPAPRPAAGANGGTSRASGSSVDSTPVTRVGSASVDSPPVTRGGSASVDPLPVTRRESAQVVGGEASAQLASLLRTLHSKAGRSVPRAGSRDHWLSIPITADLQLSAHRVTGEDVEVLQKVADHLRALLVAGFRDFPPNSPSQSPPGPGGSA